VLTLPLSGAPVPFFVAGRFGRPSISDGDAAIEILRDGTTTELARVGLMVRVRKSANSLTTGERDRFLAAFARLNQGGQGLFRDFPRVHSENGLAEAHGRSGFLPWHRAFLLDLERELQKLDRSVSLPYWDFGRTAPKIFSRSFMGVPSTATGTLEFSADNPLQFWMTEAGARIVRRPGFNAATGRPFVLNEAQTLSLGGQAIAFENFRGMEGDPHGFTHTSFTGDISDPATAGVDPLFYLLHANVDRLWAKWQWFNNRFDATKVETYQFQGSAGQSGSTRIGHNLKDSMWPWNGATQPPRPPSAPGGAFPSSAIISAPGNTPTVATMIDFQGTLQNQRRLGFDYDDVPFEF
jgi:tyrosinase